MTERGVPRIRFFDTYDAPKWCLYSRKVEPTKRRLDFGRSAMEALLSALQNGQLPNGLATTPTYLMVDRAIAVPKGKIQFQRVDNDGAAEAAAARQRRNITQVEVGLDSFIWAPGSRLAGLVRYSILQYSEDGLGEGGVQTYCYVREGKELRFFLHDYSVDRASESRRPTWASLPQGSRSSAVIDGRAP